MIRILTSYRGSFTQDSGYSLKISCFLLFVFLVLELVAGGLVMAEYASSSYARPWYYYLSAASGYLVAPYMVYVMFLSFAGEYEGKVE